MRSRGKPVERNGKARVLEELDHVYPNGVVVEPDGSIVWVESYTLRVVRRRPDGAKQVIHTMPDGHIPDGLKIDADGNFWITAVAAGGVDVIDKDGKPLHFLETGGTILNCVFGNGGALYCCHSVLSYWPRHTNRTPLHPLLRALSALLRSGSAPFAADPCASSTITAAS